MTGLNLPGFLRRIPLDVWLAAGVAISTLAVLTATLADPGMTWDEGYSVDREEKVERWFARLTGRSSPEDRRASFREATLRDYWPFSREEPNGHPPFYAMIGSLGWVVSHHWLGPLESRRFGPAVLFSFTAALMFGFLWRRLSPLAALAASGSWVLMPRVFAHAHLASYDIPLACVWFLTFVAFWKAHEGWQVSRRAGLTWSIVFAVVLAAAASTKFTGWLIPFPLALWTVVAGWNRARGVSKQAGGWLMFLVVVLLWMGPIVSVISGYRDLSSIDRGLRRRVTEQASPLQPHAVTALVAETFRSRYHSLVPAWWALVPALVWLALVVAGRLVHEPWHSANGLGSIWAGALAITPLVMLLLNPPWWHAPWRGMALFLWSNLSRAQSIPIATMFFGNIYPFSLPWCNTLVWTAITVPVCILLLAVIGLVATLATRPRESWRLLIVLNWATLMIVRAFPGAPGHDGERQLLATFPFLACLAGVGAEALWRVLSRWHGVVFGRYASAGVLGAALLSGAVDIWNYHPCQLSYYNIVVGGLRGAARLGMEPTYYWDAMTSDVRRWLNENTGPEEGVAFCAYPFSLEYLHRWNLLRPPIRPIEPGPTNWYVLQNRPGSFHPYDRWLVSQAQPAMTKALKGVPLIWVFSFQDYELARSKTDPHVHPVHEARNE